MNFQKNFPSLTSDCEKYFKQHLKMLDFKRGDYVYQSGEEPRGLYFLESGLIGLTIIGKESGKEHLLRFFKSGQYFGHRSLFSLEAHHATAMALEKTKLQFIDKKAVFSVLDKNPKIYHDIAIYLARELGNCENQRVMILENQVLPRTAQALVYLKNLKPDHAWTRQEIANFTASTTATIIRAMAELEDLGLIKQSGRTIEILNQDGLLNL